jgi:putative flavoprotein involved in K+ transport
MIRSLRPAGEARARVVDVVVVGAGHAGLAFSAQLARRGIEHVVLERGLVAHAWRRERWDSLRLLTPNWQTRLPGFGYAGADPDGFMTAAEVGDLIATYARQIDAPVQTATTVTSVCPSGSGYRVVTDRGEWWCAAVVLASGACNVPIVPAVRASLPPSIASLTPFDYRNPTQLDDGGVLVVGASATGVQLADEIQRSGRPVTLAVGSHIRLPRTYRGRDIQRWMDAIGVLDERYDAVDDVVRARRVPSPQLAGTATRRTLDLNALRDAGVRIVGRLVGVVGGKAQFSGSLTNDCAMADLKMRRLLDRIDDWIARSESSDRIGRPDRPAPTHVDPSPRLSLDVCGEFRSVVWATGFRPDYRWLDVPVFDKKGRLRHDGGVVDAPGVYAMGLTFMRRRKSSFIHGAEDDTAELAAHLASYLEGLCRSRDRKC